MKGEKLSTRIMLKELNAVSVAIMVFNPFKKSCGSDEKAHEPV
jgi:hypothetical protein